MKTETDCKLLTIFINSTDQWHGQPLYSAIVHLCQTRGIAGATVSRCVEGYGAGHKLHTSRLLELTQNMPLRIDIVDSPAAIEALLTELGSMIQQGLALVSNVHVIRFGPDPKS